MGFFNPVTSIIIFFPLSVDDFLRFMFALGRPTSRMLKVDSLHYTGDGGGGTPGNSWWGCATRFSKS